jgi:hypothetical protein
VERALESHEPFVVLSPGDIRVSLPPMGSPRRTAATASSASGTAAREAFGSSSSGSSGSSSSSDNDSGAASGAAGGASAASASSSSSSFAGPAVEREEEVAVPPSLTGLLRNEHLAHEIILNPDFKLEERRPEQGAQGPLVQQLAQVCVCVCV